MEDGILHLDEASARQLVLVRAIEDADPQGKLLSAVEREQLEREALASSHPTANGGIDFARYLQQRARRMLAAVENRNPRIAALQDPDPWRGWVLAALPVAACLLGAAIDRIDNPQQVNMLSPPLLGVLAWNLAVYVLLLVGTLVPTRWGTRAPLAAAQRWMAGIPGHGRRTGRLRTDVLARFHGHWTQVAGAQEALWWKQLLHLSAAGWALGLAFSIVLGGVVREYRVGWESTLLDLGQVHAFLSVLFAPVVLLLPFEAFSAADLQRMAFRSGAAVAAGEAARWVWMYVALLALVVVLPRVLLAAWSAWRRRRLARAVRIDLRDAYYVQVLARVSPARITLGMVGEGPARDVLLRLLHEVADHPRPRDGSAWTVLATAKGDVLRLFQVPPGFHPPAPAVTAQAGGPGAAQAWLQDLLGRFRAAPRPQERDAVQSTLAETDLMLLLPASIGDLQASARLLHWVAQPTLVLAPGDEEHHRSAAQRLALAADVLPLADCTAHWMRDARLLEAVAARLPPSKRAGFERLSATWSDRHAVRFGEAMRLLAAELVRAARDVEEVGSSAVGLRHLVNAAERDAAQRARDGARVALLQRLRDGEAAVVAELVQLHRSGTPVAPLPAARVQGGFEEQQVVDTPQAGMAGAATGAAMGAGIDLITGGLTLGAATALGAMIGGGAAYVAAAWKNRSTPSGQPLVQLGDELLETVTENLLLAYLSVAHRRVPEGDAQGPAAWRSEVVASVAARRNELAATWQQARQAADPAASVAAVARELEAVARGLLARL
ncbi:DUF3482 domain-containing protein [Ramlibacter pallidus]|uniref:DUF3482 domain-containing protein n=1 Tax=Ramlibacter pallidus TaxID=2780087 RepID=A0ABR9S4C3_9BURK|nr:DUF3482 domain-containing protein [Ramlibacter pallidus]